MPPPQMQQQQHSYSPPTTTKSQQPSVPIFFPPQLSPQELQLLESREDLARSIATYTDSLTTVTRQLPEDPTVLFFFSSSVPAVPLADYAMRLVKYMKASPAVFVVAMCYLEKISQKHRMTVNRVLRAATADSQALTTRVEIPVITALSGHRFLFATCVAAAKFLDDFFFDTAYYASVGGIQPLELARLEWAFFRLLDFNACCFPEDVKRMVGKLMCLRPQSSATLSLSEYRPGGGVRKEEEEKAKTRRPSPTTILAETEASTLGAH